MPQYRIAILSNFTFDTIVRYLDESLKFINSKAEYYLSPFNQYAQDILDLGSRLYQFEPEVVILALEGERLFPGLIEYPYGLELKDKESRIDNIILEMDNFCKTLTRNSKALILCHNFIIPSYAPLGILDTKSELGIKEIYCRLNKGLWELNRKYPSVFIFDIDSLSAVYGKEHAREEKLRYLAAMDLSEDFMAIVAREYLRYLKPLKGMTKKCLVLDLDNVLWGGVVGEDGLSGIKLGHQAPGNAYLSFQKSILNLHKRGVILCINSRNNFDDAMEVFRRHPDMALKEEHFASIKINWNDKVTNLKEISEELNINLDSFVFVDDNPLERMMVRQLLPQVEVVEMPEDPALFKKKLEALDYFEAHFITEEDKKRGTLYIQERKRQDFKSNFKDLDSFLLNLKTRCCVKLVDELSLLRVSQLIQRTNQFNLTTRRYTEAQLRAFLDEDKHLFLAISLEDIFGDNGIVGAAIVLKDQEGWDLDTFLLSCRILGRKVEHAFLAKIIERLKSKAATRLFATFIPTKKNAPSKDLLKDCGFQSAKPSNTEISRWTFDLKDNLQIPKWIDIRDG